MALLERFVVLMYDGTSEAQTVNEAFYSSQIPNITQLSINTSSPGAGY